MLPDLRPSRLTALCFICTLAATIGSAAGVSAQSIDSLQSMIQRAERSNWTLRVTSPIDTLVGRVSIVADDTIAVGRTRIAISHIDDASRRVVDEIPVLGGAVIGGVILGVIGCNLLPCGGDYNCGDSPIMLGGLGAALGSLIGAFVGKSLAEEKWQRLWTRQ